MKSNIYVPDKILLKVATAPIAMTVELALTLHQVGMNDVNQILLHMKACNPRMRPQKLLYLKKS